MNIEKIKYFIHLIEKERTGSAKVAAEKIGVSERMVFHYVNILKNQLNAPINYNREKQSFVFVAEGKLHLLDGQQQVTNTKPITKSQRQETPVAKGNSVIQDPNPNQDPKPKKTFINRMLNKLPTLSLVSFVLNSYKFIKI